MVCVSEKLTPVRVPFAGSKRSKPSTSDVAPPPRLSVTAKGFADAVSSVAELISAPSAFTAVTGAAHWQVLVRARAIETQCYVLAAGQGGEHPGPRQTFGHSAIVDPWGRVLAEQDQGQAVLLASRDGAEQAAIRQRMPVQAHRRILSSDAVRPIAVE